MLNVKNDVCRIGNKYLIDILILNSKDDVNDSEYVLFYSDESWNVVGPMDYMSTLQLNKLFQKNGIRFFVCCEEEFIEKGLPRDSLATEYFPENELNWR